MVGHGGSCAGSYLADPTSPIPSHRASIVATSTLRVKFFLWPVLVFCAASILFFPFFHTNIFFFTRLPYAQKTIFGIYMYAKIIVAMKWIGCSRCFHVVYAVVDYHIGGEKKVILNYSCSCLLFNLITNSSILLRCFCIYFCISDYSKVSERARKCHTSSYPVYSCNVFHCTEHPWGW